MRKSILYALYILVIVMNLRVIAYRIFDIQITRFEDGSGQITYCVPFSPCSK